MQARPHLDQRVLGILSLLSEQFGMTTPEGQIVDVRITHTQLATAVGATRATITRTLGDLRHQNKLSIINTADGERFCLLQWEPGHHGPHSKGC
jgi:CRP-like cAMP-binding protein